MTEYRKGFGIRQYLSLVTVAVILITSALVSGYLYSFLRASTITDVRGALEILVTTGSMMISGEDIEELSSKPDYGKASYGRVYDVLRTLTVANRSKGFRENSIYILKPTPDGAHTIFAAHLPGDAAAPDRIGSIRSMANSERNYIGDKYQYTTLMREVITEKVPFASTDIYTDAHGTWVSAYAPIRAKSGRVVGILEADFELNALTMRINREFVFVGLAVLVSALLGISLIVIFSGRISKPIKKLADAVDRIAHGNFDTGIKFNRTDEIGYLGDHINAMAVSLEEKLHLSRYVSSETMQRVSHKSGHSAMRASVCCMFADVRGFTKYSEGRDPGHVIAVLNELFGMESSCVSMFEGSIDKFIGDEIMVTFEGGDAPHRAVRASLHMMESTKVICSREGFSIGIGIHEGDVIRGDLGSSTRMDYTVIGSTVNLASRLCAAAKGGQILISERVKDLTGHKFETTSLGRARIKGFSSLISVYNVIGEDAKEAA